MSQHWHRPGSSGGICTSGSLPLLSPGAPLEGGSTFVGRCVLEADIIEGPNRTGRWPGQSPPCPVRVREEHREGSCPYPYGHADLPPSFTSSSLLVSWPCKGPAGDTPRTPSGRFQVTCSYFKMTPGVSCPSTPHGFSEPLVCQQSGHISFPPPTHFQGQ